MKRSSFLFISFFFFASYTELAVWQFNDLCVPVEMFPLNGKETTLVMMMQLEQQIWSPEAVNRHNNKGLWWMKVACNYIYPLA